MLSQASPQLGGIENRYYYVRNTAVDTDWDLPRENKLDPNKYQRAVYYDTWAKKKEPLSKFEIHNRFFSLHPMSNLFAGLFGVAPEA